MICDKLQTCVAEYAKMSLFLVNITLNSKFARSLAAKEQGSFKMRKIGGVRIPIILSV